MCTANRQGDDICVARLGKVMVESIMKPERDGK